MYETSETFQGSCLALKLNCLGDQTFQNTTQGLAKAKTISQEFHVMKESTAPKFVFVVYKIGLWKTVYISNQRMIQIGE